MAKDRSEIDYLHARMIVFVACTIAITFAITVIGFVYFLGFVEQPEKQSPNDAAFIDLLKTLSIFMTGTLSGLVAANGLKRKPTETTSGTPTP
jgi:O-antigen/teichoic acid export membrane protein